MIKIFDFDEDDVSTEEPAVSAEGPAVSAEGPAVSAEVPAVSAEVPAVSTEVPAVSTEVPAVSTEVPAVTAKEPAVTAKEPAVTTREPAVTTREPAVTTKEPAVTTNEPAVTTREPAATTNEPAVTTKEPAATTNEPAVAAKNTNSSGDGEKDSSGTKTSAAPQSKRGSKSKKALTEPIIPLEIEAPDKRPESIPPISEESELELQIAEIEADLKLAESSKDTTATVSGGGADVPAPVQKDTVADVPVDQAVKPEENSKKEDSGEVIPPEVYVPDSPAETIRKTGMAYSAAIALFGSVVFMLIIGWLADLLLGIRPWGTVIGIVVGAAIGFMQFFQITSKIINPKKNDFARVSIMNPEAEIDPAKSDSSESVLGDINVDDPAEKSDNPE